MLQCGASFGYNMYNLFVIYIFIHIVTGSTLPLERTRAVENVTLDRTHYLEERNTIIIIFSAVFKHPLKFICRD